MTRKTTRKTYSVVTSEKELDSLAMRGSLERICVGRCTIGYTTRFIGNCGARGKQEPYPWNIDIIGGHEDGGHYSFDSYRTLVEAFRAARKVSRVLDELVLSPDLIDIAKRIVEKGKTLRMTSDRHWKIMRSPRAGAPLRCIFEGNEEKARTRFKKISDDLRQGKVELIDSGGVSMASRSAPNLRTRW